MKRITLILIVAIGFTACKKQKIDSVESPRDKSQFLDIADGRNVIDFTLDGQDARIITSNNYSAKGAMQKFAMFFHFFGGNYTTPMSSKLHDSLLNNGYSIVAMSVGKTWGNSHSQNLYVNLYHYAIKKLNVELRPLGVAESMGSLTMLNISDKNSIPFSGMINIIGVVNLGEYYSRQVTLNPTTAAVIQTAYGFSNPADSTLAFAGYDPYKRIKIKNTDTTYTSTNAPVYFVSGALDQSAPTHWQKKMHKGLINAGSNSILTIVPNVGHDTAIVTPLIANSILKWAKLK